MSTINLRESNIPAMFKAKVESTSPTCEVIDLKTNTLREEPVQLPLVSDPVTHLNAALDPIAVFFMTCASIMSCSTFKVKDKSALVFNKGESGEVIAACIADYDKEGDNYHYYFSFDVAEIKSIKNSVNFGDFASATSNMKFEDVFDYEYEKHYWTALTNKEMIKVFSICILETIYNFLDINAKEGEVVELIIDGVTGNYKFNIDETQYNELFGPIAIASVEVIKDVKKMNIQFAEEFKAIAKGSSDVIN